MSLQNSRRWSGLILDDTLDQELQNVSFDAGPGLRMEQKRIVYESSPAVAGENASAARTRTEVVRSCYRRSWPLGESPR